MVSFLCLDVLQKRPRDHLSEGVEEGFEHTKPHNKLNKAALKVRSDTIFDFLFLTYFTPYNSL